MRLRVLAGLAAGTGRACRDGRRACLSAPIGKLSQCVWVAGRAGRRGQPVTRRRGYRPGRFGRTSGCSLWELQEALAQRNPRLGRHCRTRTQRLSRRHRLAASARTIPDRPRMGGTASREHPATSLGSIGPRLGSRHPRLLRDPTSEQRATGGGPSRTCSPTSPLTPRSLACASILPPDVQSYGRQLSRPGRCISVL